MGDWAHIEVDVAAEAAETASSALIDAGATGVEERDAGEGSVTLVAYFPARPDPDVVAAFLAAAPGVEAGRRSGLRPGTTPDKDWLELWKRGFEPTPIGARLLVLPSWKQLDARSHPDRALLQVDPGMAFGTGTHETTQLCLTWLDESWHGGELLDVGTGTGILAIAAAVLARETHAVGVDVDPLAIEIARENAAINGVEARVELRVGGADAATETFDAVVANLTADVLVRIAADLEARVRPGGTLVVSGVLVEQEGDVARAIEDRGLVVESVRRQGEWIALVAKSRR
jgi:ribosomal protein L11 methyltransferase